LNEAEILNSLSSRYFQRKIYTYTGSVLVALNPRHAVVPDDSCEAFMGTFASEVKTMAVGLSDDISGTIEEVPADGIRRHSIIINGESGSGKTEVAKLLTMLLITAEVQSSRDFWGVRMVDDAYSSDEDSDDDSLQHSSSKFPRSASRDSMMGSPNDNGRNSPVPSSVFSGGTNVKSSNLGSPRKSVFFKAYQLATMERIRQVTPILEAFGNACIAHTQNSSRLGKYAELSFSKRGDLLRGEIRTYLLENVRVTKQLDRERNFHVFYQLAAGATQEEKKRWAVGDISKFHFANQGGERALTNVEVDDAAEFRTLKENFANLGFDEEVVEGVLQIVAGILHLGEIDFTVKTTLEGQVSVIAEKYVEEGFTQETELSASARLCSLPEEDLSRSLTVRSVLLNKELFRKALTEPQAYHARDALAKAVYKRLFNWLVEELNAKLRPTDVLPAEVASCVGILDIFGFDSFAVNTFEQLCINYANEALQQHFAQHMFKLEMEEYKREAIPFENIEFPDNQESLDLITNGLFTILDDQCRIPNPTDKRYVSQLYKELTQFSTFSKTPLMESAGQFCVQHFAGPVIYSSDKFIEKNLDELPQDAKDVLQRSGNPILVADTPAIHAIGSHASASLSHDSADPPRAPVMSAYVSKTKVDPGSRLPGAPAPARRGSAMGKGVPNSIVTQLRNEVAVMMTHINATVSTLLRSV
jgi:myosin heavy subunit